MNAPAQISLTSATPFRFTVDQFLALCDQGLFDDYSKSELIEGEIYCMNAQHSWHARTKSNLMVELANTLRALGSDLEAWAEASTRVSDYSLAEPDIVVTGYRGDHIVPLESVAMIVEVSDTTLKVDMGRKLRIYAQAGIPEYWVVDRKGSRVIRMWAPSGKAYAQRDEVALGGPVASATIKGLVARAEK